MPANRKKRAERHPQTRAQRWKKPDERTLEVTLPSGNEAVIRMMPLDEALIAGCSVLGMHSATAVQLLDKLDASLWQGGMQGNELRDMTPEQLQFIFGFLGSMRALAPPICQAVFVSPRIVEADADPDEDEITLDDLTNADQLFVVGRVFGVDDIFTSFFPSPDGGGDAGPGGDEVQDEAEPDPEG